MYQVHPLRTDFNQVLQPPAQRGRKRNYGKTTRQRVNSLPRLERWRQAVESVHQSELIKSDDNSQGTSSDELKEHRKSRRWVYEDFLDITCGSQMHKQRAKRLIGGIVIGGVGLAVSLSGMMCSLLGVLSVSWLFWLTVTFLSLSALLPAIVELRWDQASE